MAPNIGLQRMNELLCHWEKSCLFWHLGDLRENNYLAPKVSYPNYTRFRDCILRMSETDIAKEAYLKYVPFPPSQWREELSLISTIPTAIIAWNYSSRRVFNLSSDIQNLLDATSLSNIKVRDIKVPFDSFVISLNDPLISEDGTRYDSILACQIELPVSEKKSCRTLELRLLPERLSEIKKIKSLQLKRYYKIISRGGLSSVQKIFSGGKSYTSSADEIAMPAAHFSLEYPDEKIADTVEILRNNKDTEIMGYAMDSALHIFTNFCIYLENFPSSAKKYVQKQKKFTGVKSSRATSGNAFIAKTSELFEVSCQFKMQKEEIREIVSLVKSSKMSHEKRVHWRRAHWRRKPGYGDIPFEHAPKDWISMCLINAHKLPQSTLPLASEAIT